MSSTFVCTTEEIETFKGKIGAMAGSEGFYVAWATDPAAIAAMVPAPLKPTAPIVISYIADIGEPNFAGPYREAAICVPVLNGETPGIIMPSILVTGPGRDNAMVSGRLTYSMPKSQADEIELSREGDKVHGSITRRGVKFFELDGTVGSYNDPAGEKMFGGNQPGARKPGTDFFVRPQLNQGADGHMSFDDFELVTLTTATTYESWEPMSAEVKLADSDCDPWAALPVAKVLGGGWAKFGIDLLGVTDSQKLTDDEAEAALPKVMKGIFDPEFYTD